MIDINLVKTIFFVNLLSLILASYCDPKLWNKLWFNEWRLLLIDNGNSSQYQLLREWNIQNPNNLYMICNSEPRVVTAKCDKRYFNTTLPLDNKCAETNSVQPTKIIDEEASYCPYTLYKVGFNIQIGSNEEQFYETYQVCFDHEHMRPLFTINKAYPAADRRPDGLIFNPDEIFYGKNFYAFTRPNTFARFKKLLGDTQQYMSSYNLDHIVDRGHLTPSSDFVTANLKKSTFNMINVVPQFKTINNGNWRLIEEWSRHSNRTPANICTGVLDCNLNSKNIEDLSCILRLKHVNGQMVPIFLADTSKVPIPLWVYKIVTSKDGVRTVFLTYNNIYHDGDIEPPSDVCQAVQCPLDLAVTIQGGRTFCCNYDEFMNNAVPTLKDIC